MNLKILPAKLTTVFTGLGGRKYAIIAGGDQFNRIKFMAKAHRPIDTASGGCEFGRGGAGAVPSLLSVIEAVLCGWEFAAFNRAGESPDRFFNAVLPRHEVLDEAWGARRDAEQVMEYQYLGIGIRPGTDTNYGDSQLLADGGRQLPRYAL